MNLYECSLKCETPQSIPDDGNYHVVRFPFGSAEPLDTYCMHQMAQPDGYTVTDWSRDDRSGLIWPAVSGWGVLSAMIQWEPGSYRELRDRFVRNPLSLTGRDSTDTVHRPPSPGMQAFDKVWQMKVTPGTPLGLLVAHDDDMPRRVTLAEFKLAIFSKEEL